MRDRVVEVKKEVKRKGISHSLFYSILFYHEVKKEGTESISQSAQLSPIHSCILYILQGSVISQEAKLPAFEFQATFPNLVKGARKRMRVANAQRLSR